MSIVTAIILIILGLLAASSLIGSWSEDAGDIIEKLRPVQGAVGILGAVAGLVILVQVLLAASEKGSTKGIMHLIPTIGGPVLLTAVGFLMGYSMITSLLASSREAQERADEIYESLVIYQVPLGLAAIALGVWHFFL